MKYYFLNNFKQFIQVDEVRFHIEECERPSLKQWKTQKVEKLANFEHYSKSLKKMSKK